MESVIYTDINCNILKVINPKILGYKQNELIGKNIVMLIPPKYREMHYQKSIDFIKTGHGNTIGKWKTVQILKKNKSSHKFKMCILLEENEKYYFKGIFKKINSNNKIFSTSMKCDTKFEIDLIRRKSF